MHIYNATVLYCNTLSPKPILLALTNNPAVLEPTSTACPAKTQSALGSVSGASGTTYPVGSCLSFQ